MDEDQEIKRPLLSPGSSAVNSDLNYQTLPPVTSSVNEDSINANQPLKVYKRRWYILVLFSLYAFSQNAVWNTWGPISTSSEEAFGWTDSTIAWLNNWGPVAYIMFGLLFPWLLQVKGLRWAVLPSMFLVVLGCACRVITSEPGAGTILIHIGQFLNGVAGPVGMGAIPTLSSQWFPPKERVTATSISVCISVVGSALPFVLGPVLVPTGPPKAANGTTTTSPLSTTNAFLSDQNEYLFELPNVTASRVSQERKEIMRYMYYECGWSALIFILILIYFPSKPPHPPCPSATVVRDKYWTGMWSLKSKGYFVLLSVIYGISLGVINCWASVLNVNLNAINVSESEAGWIGFYATLASAAGSMLIGRFGDIFARRMTLFILVMYILGAGCFVVFTLVLIKVIPYSDVLLYATVIGGNGLINAAVPMIYELGCELAYPTSEGAANGFLTYLNNMGGLFFLAVFAVPHIGTMWMNWAALGSIVICIPMIAALKGRFNRLEVDEGVRPQLYVEQEADVPCKA
ncbi:solute carrier family 49 member 4-like [Physella acuta]|uniref:solute carrier family 49 member 4-like n=1 Tax=Physella acuta TaxID=109671 RepID=UPI0027DE7ED9|nr:solute carrier family 49 member 4-like [Physella acuta]XP_059177518.1 solute carrier family 49 member 4-like [Physella acuta]XP_059177519.1 solute carrier family 49 member 4-like [Physella acuta]